MASSMNTQHCRLRDESYSSLHCPGREDNIVERKPFSYSHRLSCRSFVLHVPCASLDGPVNVCRDLCVGSSYLRLSASSALSVTGHSGASWVVTDPGSKIFVTDTWGYPEKWDSRSRFPCVMLSSSQIPALFMWWEWKILNPLWIIFLFSCWAGSVFCPSTLLSLSHAPFMCPLCSLW